MGSKSGNGVRNERAGGVAMARALTLAITLAVATPASAGLGGYVEYGLVQYAANWMDDGFVQDGDQAHAIGLGVAWDDNLAMDKLLNYRVNIGLRQLIPSEGDDELHLTGISGQFTLGFGLVRDERMRVWLGPSIGASYLICGDCAGPGDNADAHQASIGLGPEFGLNYHLDERLTLSVTARYTFESTAQKVYEPVDTIFDRGWHGRPSLNFSFFFRADDDQFDADSGGGGDDDGYDDYDDYDDEY